MEDLNELLLSEGQHYEVHRHGNFATLVLGLKDKEKRYIAFQPFADIQTGDDLVEQISRDRFEVVDTEIEVNQRIAYRKKAFIKKYQPTPVKNPGDLLNPGEHYHVERKSQQIGQVWAAKDIEEKTGRKIVWFFPDVDVQAGDFLVNIETNNRYRLIEMESVFFEYCRYKKAYYENCHERADIEKAQTFNIGTAYSSIIGSQQQALLSMVSNLPAIREEIERRGGNDAQALRCMIDEVQALMDHHGTLAKGFLGNFIPLLERNPWVSEALTRAILAWAMNT